MASVVYHSSRMMTQYSWSVLMKVWFTNALLNTARNFFIPTRHMKPLFTILFGIAPLSHGYPFKLLHFALQIVYTPREYHELTLNKLTNGCVLY